MFTKTFLLGTALLAAGCQATSPTTNPPTEPAANPVTNSTAPPPGGPTPVPAGPVGGGSEKLFAHRWALTEAAGQPVAPADGVRAHLLFFPPSRLGGSTGCNRLSGTFELTGGGRMTFSPLATTRMLCPEPAAAAETRFMQALGTVKTYYVTDSTLTLRDGATIVARLRATPTSPKK